MFDNFNFYKAKKFLEKTKQCKFIVQAVNGLKPYYETDVLDMIEHVIPCEYYTLEKLYCMIMQEMNYKVPFTLEELIDCIKNCPKKGDEHFNDKAYSYLKALYERLLMLYPC